MNTDTKTPSAALGANATQKSPDGPAASPGQSAISVKAGAQLPPIASAVPQLAAQQAVATAAPSGHSAIAAGMSFQGNAVISGGCMVAGDYTGNLSQAEGAQANVTIAETGHLRGDVKAHQIVVMGKTQGLLDASAGTVTLHETSNVQGHVRYAKLQVNGAELNATLEKASNKPTKNAA